MSNSHGSALSRLAEPERCGPSERGAGARRKARMGRLAISLIVLARDAQRHRASPCGAPTAAIIGSGRCFRAQRRTEVRQSRRFPAVPCAASSPQGAEPLWARTATRRLPGAGLRGPHAGRRIQPGIALAALRQASDPAGCPARRSVPLRKRPREAPLADRTNRNIIRIAVLSSGSSTAHRRHQA